MKNRLLVIAGVIGLMTLVAGRALAGDVIAPVTVTFTNFMGGSVNSQISQTHFIEGTTLVFTNCKMYVGATTNSAVQGLDGVTVEVRVGDLFTSVAYTGTVYAVGGLTNFYWVSTTVPTNKENAFVQLKGTDSLGGVGIWPLKQMLIDAPLE